MKKRLHLLAFSVVLSLTAISQNLPAFSSKTDVPISVGQKRLANNQASQKLEAATLVASGGVVSTRTAAAATIPYTYGFDNSALTSTSGADGWLITDAAAQMKGGAAITGLSALSGSTYLTSNYDSNAARNAWAFSPDFTLTAGTTYYVSIYAYVPGYLSDKDEFKLTVGSDQTSASQTTILIDKTGANAEVISSWKKFEVTFTPSIDGIYYFAIAHCTSIKDINMVAFEDFRVGTTVAPPTANIYYKGGLQDANSESVILISPEEAITFTGNMQDADSFSWAFENANTTSSTQNPVSVSYLAEDTTTTTLSATNAGGTTAVTAGFNIQYPVAGLSAYVYNFKPFDGLSVYRISSNAYDYMVGPNSFYTKFAEKYEVPANTIIEVTRVILPLYRYRLSTTDRAKNLTVSIYDVDVNGLPGTLIGSVSSPYSTVFGTTNITTGSSLTSKSIAFTSAVSVTGSFFIVVDFGSITVSTTNYLALASTSERTAYADNTFYTYSSSTWEGGPDDNYGVASYIIPYITYTKTTTSINGSKADKSATQAYYADGKLNITNANAGNAVYVYNLSGSLVYSNILTDSNTALNIPLAKGVYLVKAAGKASKIIVN
ncbi:MAG: T9SS type A sorting domain-containing protein [Dysgonomonas sp.]